MVVLQTSGATSARLAIECGVLLQEGRSKQAEQNMKQAASRERAIHHDMTATVRALTHVLNNAMHSTALRVRYLL
jgi:hypothetical protein